MAQALAHDLWILICDQKERRAGMAQVIQANPRQFGFFEDRAEITIGKIRNGERVAHLSTEDQIMCFPIGPQL